MTALEFIAKIVEHVAWPVTILILVLLIRKQLGLVFSVVIKFLSQSNRMKVGKDGIELERKIEFIAETVKVEREEQKSINSFLLLDKGQNTENSHAFEDIAQLYRKVNEPDKAKRILLKNTYGLKMGQVIIQNNISKADLVNNIDDAKIVGICYAIKLSPSKSDLTLVKEIASKAQSLHAKYRVVATLGDLIELHKEKVSDYETLNELLTLFENGADDNLIKRIIRTKYILRKNQDL